MGILTDYLIQIPAITAAERLIQPGEVFIGKDWGKERNYSEKTAETIDNEVRRLVEEAEKRALALLTKNRKVLEKLAKTLLEKEVVEGYELDALLGIKTPKAPKPTSGFKKNDGNPPAVPGTVVAPDPTPA
jgi:cell division protease FtsH